MTGLHDSCCAQICILFAFRKAIDQFKGTSILEVRTHYKPTETFSTRISLPATHQGSDSKGFIKDEALRLLRTNSSETTFHENITQFKPRLHERGYIDTLVNKVFSEVKLEERKSALQQKEKTHKEILLYVTQYHPAVPN